MKRILRTVILFTLIMTVVSVFATVSFANEENSNQIITGWQTADGKKYYYDTDGNMVKSSLLTIDGKKYYFGKDGVMYNSRLISVNNKKYYLGKDGAAYTKRLISLKGIKYYLGSDGVAYKSRLISVSGKKYYIGSDCKAYKNKFASIDGNKYYFGSDSVMRTGWRNIKDSNGVYHKYYFGKDGVARTRWRNITLSSGKTYKYYFNPDGTMATGFITIGKKTYYIRQNGRYYSGWITDNQVFSEYQINKASKNYSIKVDSTSFLALVRINSNYSERLSSSSKNGTLLFLMEGAGRTGDISLRKNALGVLVKNHTIKYLNRNCSTLPDCPFDPARNYDTPMPTLKSGIYGFHTIYHSSATTQCAGLNVEGANVVRHRNRTDYYSSTSSSINIHRRNRDFVAKTPDEQISSAGCLVIGNSGKGSADDYATYSAILGITNPGDSGTASYSHTVSGKVIVDRSYAKTYLKNIGYTDGAIELIG